LWQGLSGVGDCQSTASASTLFKGCRQAVWRHMHDNFCLKMEVFVKSILVGIIVLGIQNFAHANQLQIFIEDETSTGPVKAYHPHGPAVAIKEISTLVNGQNLGTDADSNPHIRLIAEGKDCLIKGESRAEVLTLGQTAAAKNTIIACYYKQIPEFPSFDEALRYRVERSLVDGTN